MGRPEDALKVYDQICASYRAIDDFRAKLLGFLPLATGGGVLVLVDKFAKAAGYLPAIGAFGCIVTLGLFAYELYGIRKCAALISAGRAIETYLNIDHGQFLKRPQNIASVINEPFASGLIYPGVLAAWLYISLIHGLPRANPWLPIIVFALGFAGTVAYDARLSGRWFRTKVK